MMSNRFLMDLMAHQNALILLFLLQQTSQMIDMSLRGWKNNCDNIKVSLNIKKKSTERWNVTRGT